jgi:small subunit ribosomal protein S19
MRSSIKSLISINIKGGPGKTGKFFKPFYRNMVNKRSDFYIWSRRALVTSKFVGKRVAVYNGRRFLSFIVRKSMIGYKFGEFSLTKKIGAIHKIYKRAAKLSRNRKKFVARKQNIKSRGPASRAKGSAKTRKTVPGKKKTSRLELR